MTERVIVATHDHDGQILGVFENEEVFENWVEKSDHERYDIDTWDCNVRS